MTNDQSFWLVGWKLKDSDTVMSDKKLLHNATDDQFEKEPVRLIISREDARWIAESLIDEEDEDDPISK